MKYYIINTRDNDAKENYCMICRKEEIEKGHFHYFFYFLRAGRLKKIVSKEFIKTSINLLPDYSKWVCASDKYELTSGNLNYLFRQWFSNNPPINLTHCIREIK